MPSELFTIQKQVGPRRRRDFHVAVC